MVDINPASAGVNVQVSRFLVGERVADGSVAPLVVVMCCRSQETGSNWSVLSQEV